MGATPTSNATAGWNDLLDRAGRELCEALGLGGHTLLGRREALPAGRLGACIPLVGPVQIQLLMLATNSGVRELAAAMLHHQAGEPELTREDVQDAFRELANQFAGLTKRRLSGMGELRLGLPVFIRGVVRPPAGVGLYVHDVRWGGTALTLALMTSSD